MQQTFPFHPPIYLALYLCCTSPSPQYPSSDDRLGSLPFLWIETIVWHEFLSGFVLLRFESLIFFLFLGNNRTDRDLHGLSRIMDSVWRSQNKFQRQSLWRLLLQKNNNRLFSKDLCVLPCKWDSLFLGSGFPLFLSHSDDHHNVSW